MGGVSLEYEIRSLSNRDFWVTVLGSPDGLGLRLVLILCAPQFGVWRIWISAHCPLLVSKQFAAIWAEFQKT